MILILNMNWIVIDDLLKVLKTIVTTISIAIAEVLSKFIINNDDGKNKKDFNGV